MHKCQRLTQATNLESAGKGNGIWTFDKNTRGFLSSRKFRRCYLSTSPLLAPHLCQLLPYFFITLHSQTSPIRVSHTSQNLIFKFYLFIFSWLPHPSTAFQIWLNTPAPIHLPIQDYSQSWYLFLALHSLIQVFTGSTWSISLPFHCKHSLLWLFLLLI